MTDAVSDTAVAPRGFSWRRWRNRKIASRGFQSWASRFPLTRGHSRREGQRLFDLVSGFVYSQVLAAVVELDLLEALRDAPQTAQDLGKARGIAPDRMEALCQAAAALDLFERVGDGYQLSALGAALIGAPGVIGMIQHHDVFYRDLADPVALLRGEKDTELAHFWPYVFGAGAAENPQVAERYSKLMADSQTLVAEETLRTVSFDGITHLLDVGGGTGAFLAAVGAAYPDLQMTLFDLPAVVPAAQARFRDAGMAGRTTVTGGSFRDDPLPQGADAISLIRVCYDHADDTVRALMAKIYATLPPGGRFIVSEPMGGGARPERSGDAYFAFYCMAMQTGTARSQARIAELMAEAGFENIQTPPTRRPYVTSVVTGCKPGAT
ncbi:methyltransferase [Rhodovulum adriaticum]|uniref:Demethylspheroidene O-methyltransferase n=1 Tax=Rhodovulum adriaticum TaxID=35804 RepID=A0A4V2SMK9_RHOAD|nr:methyltransferase [Rhodovulum adriaticum]MBK1635370.1 SAM-dependent methyltransferase [Rhodovulum adriaticum]TCP27696.1 demethylspheroidene O-methyltransferase [Rhodovulum adriaticum]